MTVPAILSALQTGGGLRALFVAGASAILLFGWWRRGVWFTNETYIVVVNWVRRTVIKAEGTELELVPLGKADVSGPNYDPRRVRTMYLVAADGTRVRVRLADGASGMRVQKSVDALRTLLATVNDSDDD